MEKQIFKCVVVIHYYKLKEVVLKKIGLSKNEIKVYLALLELGLSNVNTIVKKTGLHRPNVYYSIERLNEKGLISSCLKQNVNHYQPSNPKRLFNLLQEKEEEIANIKKEVESSMPEFLSLLNSSIESSQKVELFRGENGLKTVLDDVLENAKPNDLFVLGYTGIARKTLGPYHERWEEWRIQRKLIRKALANEENRDYLKKSKLTKVRYLPGEYSSPASTTIYGDYVVIHLTENQKPLAIRIKSKSLSQVYRNYFKLLWSISKK